MAKIAASVLCAWCRYQRDLRDGRCLRYDAGLDCKAFSRRAAAERQMDLIAWTERERDMNSYLSRAEKETFVRLTLLAGLQERIIATYAAGKNADATFLKALRTSKTWLMKALDYRTSFLDIDAARDLARQVSKLDLIFVPNDKARKEYELLKEVKSHIHLPLEDFEDWYGEVIEHTCKVCAREDYKACPMRRVMSKYGVYPANPAAQDTCQYSYVGADPADLPTPRPPREAPEEASPEETAAAAAVSESSEEAAPAEGLTVADEVEPAAAREGMSDIDIHLHDGTVLQLELPERMAANVLAELRIANQRNRPICSCVVDGDLVAIDTRDVVVFRAYGIGEWIFKAPFPEQRERVEPPKLQSYKIECKCGAEYFCRLRTYNRKARCRECGATVFMDWAAEREIVHDSGDEAILATNRYFVRQAAERPTEFAEAEAREKTGEQKPSAPAARPMPKPMAKGEYQDPCKIF